MPEISGNHRELHREHLKRRWKQIFSQVSVTLLGSLDHVMAAQGQLEMVLSLAPWLYLMMVGTTLWSGLMKTHWFP